MSVIHDGSALRMRDHFETVIEAKDAEIRRLMIRNNIEKRKAEFYKSAYHRLRHEIVK